MESSPTSDATRVQQLVDKMLSSQALPEEVCRSSPELLPEVRERWRHLCQVRDELDALFPVSLDSAASPSEGDALPQIPGYQVEEVLGRGGMGIVFRARHLRLNRVVALKMVLAGAYAGPPERERFQREAEAAAALRHPNIVQIHDIGDSDGRSYFTMEYLEGGNLAQDIAGRSVPAREAASLVATLARAVWMAHQGGIVHRDLKPSNVLLTVDGTPKIGDFGLARRLDGAAGITRTGVVAGTPNYMAPEQARGQLDAIGPAVDIYSLGVILYEMLSGRPPFDAATAEETIRRVISQEAVPPSRSNAKVPRDLDTICLKCIQKEPHRRYATALALAEDLDRFLRGEAIAARPVGRPERALRWMRRKPTATALIFTALALVGLAAGMAMRELAASAERRMELNESMLRLGHVISLQQEGRLTEARQLLDQLSDGGSDELRRRMQRVDSELGLAERLDAIRLGRAARLGQKLAFTRSAEDYEVAFREAAIGNPQEAPQVVAARIRQFNAPTAIVAALDDWAACTVDPPCQTWALEVAREADHDPTGWRTRARDPATWSNEETLVDLAAAAPVANQSVPLLLALAQHMKFVDADPILFLARVQQAHPSDFWVNLYLAEALMEKNDPTEALRFFQVAVALRPGVAVVHDNLGLALALLGRMDEADQEFRRAWEIDPSAAPTHDNLGIAFSTRLDEAADHSHGSPHFSHQVAELHTILGDNLRDQGKLVQAMDRYRRAIAIDPRHSLAQLGLRDLLIRQDRLDEARIAWGKAVDAGPRGYEAWDGYAELCLFFGHEDEYRRVRTIMLERFKSETDQNIAERLGRACLLLPGSDAELEQADVLVDRALAFNAAEPYFLFAKGLAEYRRGRLEQSVSIMAGPAARVLGPAPGLVKAMAQFRHGQQAESRQTLTEAVLSFDWQPSRADHRDIWIFHILRHEAEALILPTLSAFLEGKHQPRENDERLALVDGCQYMGYSFAAARLYADAFTQDPGLADDFRAGHRVRAARAAALTGCDLGKDTSGLDDHERRRWRDQALQWLRADLTAWNEALAADPENARPLIRQTLTRWRGDRDLTGVRERDALEKLSEDERIDFGRFWGDVNAILYWVDRDM